MLHLNRTILFRDFFSYEEACNSYNFYRLMLISLNDIVKTLALWLSNALNLLWFVCVCTERFTVASYNILADRNASNHRDLYTNVPSFYMKWERRKKVICNELMGWNPDIICLQVRFFFLFIYLCFFNCY